MEYLLFRTFDFCFDTSLNDSCVVNVSNHAPSVRGISLFLVRMTGHLQGLYRKVGKGRLYLGHGAR